MEGRTTAAERTPRGQGELLHERLIEAALEMIDAGELAQISIRAVTKRAGVSPTAFYLHFENRDELLRACVDRCFVAFRDRIREATTEAPDGQALLGAGLGYIDFARQRPERYALIFGADAAASPPSPDGEKPAAAGDAFDDLISLVRGYVGGDSARGIGVEVLARGIWSGLHGYVTLRHARPAIDWPGEEDFARMLAEAWLGAPAN